MRVTNRQRAEKALLETLNQFHSHVTEVNSQLFRQTLPRQAEGVDGVTEGVLTDYWRLMQDRVFHHAGGLTVRQIKPTNVLQHSLNETNWSELLEKIGGQRGKTVLLGLTATTNGTYSASFALPHDVLEAHLASMPEEHVQALVVRPVLPASLELGGSVVSTNTANRVALAKFIASVIHPEKKRRK